MKTLDDKIRSALLAADADLLDDADGELPILEQVFETFRGRHRWLVALAMIGGMIMMAFGVFCAIRFFAAEDTRGMIAWAAGFSMAFLAIGAMKVWFWMEMSKNTVLREVKRVELQIARLAQRLPKT